MSKVKYVFKVGDYVELNSASFEWGSRAKKGDVCVIERITTDEHEKKIVYSVRDDMSRYSGWNCLEGDIVLFDVLDPKNVRVRFFKKYMSFLGKLPDVAGRELVKVKDELCKLEDDVRNKALLRRSLQRYIDRFDDIAEEVVKNKATQDKFDVLLRSMYEKVEFEGGGSTIVGVTKPMFVSMKGAKLALGRYTVRIHFQSGLMKIDRSMGDAGFDRKGHYQHPHITNGDACLGDFHLPLVQASEKCDYLSMFEIVYNYLGQVYEGSTYANPMLWVTDRVKRCKRCWALLTACVCGNKTAFNPVSEGDVLREGESGVVGSVDIGTAVPVGTPVVREGDGVERCEHCEASVDSCICFFCPSSGDFVSTDGSLTGCDDCEHYDENGNCTYN